MLVVIGLLAAAGEARTFAREYLGKILVHSQEVASNSVGLRSLLVFGAAPWALTADGNVVVTAVETDAAAPAPWVVPAAAGVYLLLAVPLIRRATPLTSLMYAVPLIFWGLAPTGYYYSFLVLLVLLPWRDGLPDRVRLLEMILLTAVMAVIHAFEVVSPDLIPLYYQASIAMAVFFVLWLGFEYARLALDRGEITLPAASR
jgi:hypothetical protein